MGKTNQSQLEPKLKILFFRKNNLLEIFQVSKIKGNLILRKIVPDLVEEKIDFF